MESRSDGGPGRSGPFDELDRRIVRLLQRNGKLSNTEIGRLLDVTETTIRKRVGRMIDEGLLQVLAVPTPLAVGDMTSAIIGVKAALNHVRALVTVLSDFPEVRYAGIAVGRFDVVIEAVFQNRQHLLHFLTDDLAPLEGVLDVETSMILEVAKFSYEWELP